MYIFIFIYLYLYLYLYLYIYIYYVLYMYIIYYIYIYIHTLHMFKGIMTAGKQQVEAVPLLRRAFALDRCNFPRSETSEKFESKLHSEADLSEAQAPPRMSTKAC